MSLLVTKWLLPGWNIWSCWSGSPWQHEIPSSPELVPKTPITLKWIVPGATWLDTTGAPIQAHGGGLLKVNETFYWFGEEKSHHGSTFRAVAVYTSEDLYAWTRLPDALTPLEGTAISNDSVVERPKVIWNQENDEYVMWFHSDNTNYNAAMVGVATSKTPQGPYSHLYSFKPFGADSRDEGLFVDDDGTAYLLYSSDWNNNFKISALSHDYRNVSHVTHVFYGGGYEAPGIIKRNGTYHLFISGLTGWAPNENKHLSAPSLTGPWSEPENIAPPGLRTYFSQNTFDLVLRSDAGDDREGGMVSLYMGDRWKSSQLGKSSYIWLPMRWMSDGGVWLDWVDIFSLDINTGAIVIPNGTTYHASNGTLHGNAQLGVCTSCRSKQVVRYLGAGGSVTMHNITGNGSEQWVAVYYSNADWSWRGVSISVNGGPVVILEQPDTGGHGEFLSVPMKLKLENSTTNFITFGHNQTTYAGDLDRIVVYP